MLLLLLLVLSVSAEVQTTDIFKPYGRALETELASCLEEASPSHELQCHDLYDFHETMEDLKEKTAYEHVSEEYDVYVVETPLFPQFNEKLAPIYHAGLIFHGKQKHELLTVDFAARAAPGHSYVTASIVPTNPIAEPMEWHNRGGVRLYHGYHKKWSKVHKVSDMSQRQVKHYLKSFVGRIWPRDEPNYFLFEVRTAPRKAGGKTLIPSTTCYDFVHASLKYVQSHGATVVDAELRRDYADLVAHDVECVSEEEARPFFLALAATLKEAQANKPESMGDWMTLKNDLMPELEELTHTYAYWKGKYYRVHMKEPLVAPSYGKMAVRGLKYRRSDRVPARRCRQPSMSYRELQKECMRLRLNPCNERRSRLKAKIEAFHEATRRGPRVIMGGPAIARPVMGRPLTPGLIVDDESDIDLDEEDGE